MAGDKKTDKDKKVTHCNLYSFVEEYNKPLFNILEDMCAVGQFRATRPVTFLNPGDKVVEILQDKIDSGEAENAFYELQKLFLYEKNTKLSGKLINYNNKVVTSDLSNLKTNDKFKPWSSRNIIVFDYNEKDLPKEGEKVPRPSFKKDNGKKTNNVDGGSETCSKKMEVTKELFTNLDDNKLPHKVAYVLNSLLKCLKKNDEAKFNEVINLLDPNMILSWYILVRPSSYDGHIPDEVFNEWYDLKDSYPKEVTLIKAAFDSNDYDNSLLAKAKEARKELETDGFENFKNSIISSYGNDMNKLLEDELRFRYSNEKKLSSYEIHELNNIDWETPVNSLVLVGEASKNCLYKSSLHKLMKEFTESNAFHYTMYNNKIHEKFSENIKGAGPGSKKMITLLGKTNRAFIKKLEQTDKDKSLTNFVATLDKDQLQTLKKIMKGLV